jgi:glucoamylase
VYYPRIDQACIRDLGFIVTDGDEFFSEEKRDTVAQITSPSQGTPAFTIINECNQGLYKIEKNIISDPRQPVLLQQIRFTALKKPTSNYRLFVILSPHLGNHGDGNTGWTGDYKGLPMLFAERDHFALALACSLPWIKRSAGFVGAPIYLCIVPNIWTRYY